MLYDPKWERPADALTLESLIAWLEKKPTGETYCYADSGACLAAQYNASIGRKYSTCSLPPGEGITFDQKLERIGIGSPRTFGDALKRARELAAR